MRTGGPYGARPADDHRRGDDDVERRLELAAQRRPDVGERAILRRRLGDVDVDGQVRLGERALELLGLQHRVPDEGRQQRGQQAVLVLGSLGPGRDEVGERGSGAAAAAGRSSLAGARPSRPPRPAPAARDPRGCRRGTGRRPGRCAGRPSPSSAPRTRARPTTRSARPSSPAFRAAGRRHGSSARSSDRRAARTSRRGAAVGAAPVAPSGNTRARPRVPPVLVPEHARWERRRIRLSSRSEGAPHAELPVSWRLHRGGGGWFASDRGRRNRRRRLRRPRRATGPSTRRRSSRTGASSPQTFGDFVEGSYLAHAVYGYFLNGGGACYVVRIGADGGDADGDGPADERQGEATPRPTASPRSRPDPAATTSPSTSGRRPETAEDTFKLTVNQGGRPMETFDNLTTKQGQAERRHDRQRPVEADRASRRSAAPASPSASRRPARSP